MSIEGVDEMGIDADGIHQGMYPKYQVLRINRNLPYEEWEEVDDAFVLAPSKDYHARVALAAYIESVRFFNEQLAHDLEAFFELTMPEEGIEALKMVPD